MKKVKYSIFTLLTATLFCSATLSAQEEMFSLEQCRKMALENNKQMSIMEQKVIKAQQERLSAKTKYLPSVSATGTYLYNSRDISLIGSDMYLPIGTVMSDGSFGFTQDQVNNKWTIIDGQPVPLDSNGQPFNPKTDPSKILWKQHAIIPKSALTFDTQNIFAAAVTITQPVYMGGKIRSYNKITQYAENLAKSQKDTKATEVILSVDEAYWMIVSLESKKKLAQGYHALLLKLKDDVTKLKNGGLATRADELSVEVKLNEAEMTLTRVDDGLSLSKMNLAQICGMELNADFTLEDAGKDFISAPVSKEINIASAVENRYEVKSLTTAVDIYRQKQNVVRSEFLPTLAVTGAYSMSSPNVFNGFSTTPKGLFTAGVALKVPIFHWNDRSHKMKMAKAETKIAELELAEAKEKIELQINQSMFSRRASEKKAVMSATNVAKADENLRFAQLAYKEGVASLTNVFEAQTAWLSAKSQNIDSQIDVYMAQIYLERATGTLFTPQENSSDKNKSNILK